MRATIRLIGDSILAGSQYFPTRNLAAKYATRAAPKDYLGQAAEIFKGFVNRWRYVRDPRIKELVTASPEASFRLVMAGDGIGVGEGLGAGDCDCATIALGSLLESTGFPVRIATVANPNAPPGELMEHVYPEVYVPNIGWIASDPVMWPKRGFGSPPPHSRKVVYSLGGDILLSNGNLGGILMKEPAIWRRPEWATYRGFGEVSDIGTGRPAPCAVKGFGSLVTRWGYIPGERLGGISAETPRQVDKTPILEIGPEEFEYTQYMGEPPIGCTAIDQFGSVYSYDGMGCFGSLFDRGKSVLDAIKKAVDNVVGGGSKSSKSSNSQSTEEDEEAAKRLIRIVEGQKYSDQATGTIKNLITTAQTASSQTQINQVEPVGTLKTVNAEPVGTPMDVTPFGTGELSKLADTLLTEGKTSSIPTKTVTSISNSIRNTIPVAAIVPGAGPAIRLGLDRLVHGDELAQQSAAEFIDTLSETGQKIEALQTQAQKYRNQMRYLATKLEKAASDWAKGKQQLKAAKSQIAKLKKQLKNRMTLSDQADLRATDALKMAMGLLRSQLSATTKATQTLQQNRTQSSGTATSTTSPATRTRVSAVRR